MPSRLIVAICVVGCAIAVQASLRPPNHYDEYLERMERLESLKPTSLLMDTAYNILYKLTNNVSVDEVYDLRECLTKIAMNYEKRLFGEHYDNEVEQHIERIRTEISKLSLKELVDFARAKNEAALKIFTDDEVGNLRHQLRSFNGRWRPDVKWLMESFWVRGYYAKKTEKHLFEEVSCDLYNIYISPIRKIKLTNKIVKAIKRVDEELAKTNKEEVDKMVERTPYEQLYPLGLSKLSKEARYRVDALAGNTLDEKSTYLKKILVDFIGVVEENAKFT